MLTYCFGRCSNTKVYLLGEPVPVRGAI